MFVIPKLNAVNIDLGGITPAPGAPGSIGELVTNLLGVILPLLTILFVVIIVYGGFTYMTSAGDPKKLDQARGILTNAVIGIAIVLFAFVIREIILNALS
jgi:TRAP-type C4-dicarboxylate transport system permease small subunit